MNRFIPTTFFLNLFFLIFFQSIASENPDSILSLKVKSPDGNYTVTFSTLKTAENLKPYYSITYKNKSVVGKSELDIALDNHVSKLAMAIKPDADYHFVGNMDFVSLKDTCAF